MAVVDSLLKIISVKNADALILSSTEPPYLEERGETRQLSMPALDHEVIERILGEVFNEQQRRSLSDTGSVNGQYTMNGQEVFAVGAEFKDGEHRFDFRPVGAATRTPGQQLEPEHPAPAAPRASIEPTGESAGATAAVAVMPTVATEQRPAEGSVQRLLALVVAERGSDLFLSSGSPAKMRIGGQLRELDGEPGSPEQILALMEPLMTDTHRQQLAEQGSCDAALEVRHGHKVSRFRVHLFRQQSGLAVALRPIFDEVPTLKDLNLPDDMVDLVDYRNGLVLMVGTAGSGKSTTLAALIERLNQSVAKHIVTIEDPIEYVYAPARCLVHQREVGTHVPSFSVGLRAALREAPDVILLGEMRDQATIAAALTAAETGHLVLSTLHSGSAEMAIDRIIDVFPEQQQAQVRIQLASVLRAVVTQILLPSRHPPLRVPAVEKMIVNTAVETKIRDGRCHQLATEIQKGRAEGMLSFELSLARLVRQSLLSESKARELASDTMLLTQLIRSG